MICEQVFLATGNGWALRGGAEPSGASIPISWRSEVRVLGNITGSLIDGHDGVTDLVLGKLPKDVGAVLEHRLDHIACFIEGGIGHLF